MPFVRDMPFGARRASRRCAAAPVLLTVLVMALHGALSSPRALANFKSSASIAVAESARAADPVSRDVAAAPTNATAKSAEDAIDGPSLGDRVEATVTAPDVNGLRAIYTIEPGRWGVRVEGPADRYLINGSSPARGEGSRVVIGDQDFFPTCGIPPREDSRQLLIDALRTRAHPLCSRA